MGSDDLCDEVISGRIFFFSFTEYKLSMDLSEKYFGEMHLFAPLQTVI